MLRFALLVGVAAALLGVASPRASADIGWCGSGEAATNRLPDAATGRLIHVVYAYPSDGADGFAAQASLLASIVAKTDAWWQGQDPTRTLRFDLYPFPGCGGDGSLDISAVKLPQSSAELEPSSSRFALLNRAIPSFDPAVKPIVFYDGPVDQPDLCGTAHGDPLTGSGSLAVLYLRSTCMGTADADAAVFAHELTHELGSPTQFSPHACPGDLGHVCDSNHDLMYPYLSFETIDELVLDVNRDDYYRHGGRQFDLSASGWLRHLDASMQALALSVTGGGSVTSDLPGVVCTASCTTQWETGTTVVLDAEPAPGQRFIGWAGGCSGEACSLTITAPSTVRALFGPAKVTLTVRVEGRGSVSGGGIACPGRCSAAAAAGAPVTLRAAPAKGWRFRGWTGACRGTSASCRLTPQAAATVAARFSR
jgi:hypothetical protein